MRTDAELNRARSSALEYIKAMRRVTLYILINKTKRELYVGVTNAGREPERFEEHCGSKTLALSHWDCSDDHIKPARLGTFPTRSQASHIGHLFERAFNADPDSMSTLYLEDSRVHGMVMEALKHFKGYRAIETAGV